MVSLKGALHRRRHFRDFIRRVESDDATLTEANLSSDGVAAGGGDAACARLANALRGNSHIRSVDLSGCGITKRGARALATALLTNFSIESVSLSDNPLGDDGVCCLAQALRMGRGDMKNLNLRGVGMGRYGAKALAVALSTARSPWAADDAGAAATTAPTPPASVVFEDESVSTITDGGTERTSETGDEGGCPSLAPWGRPTMMTTTTTIDDPPPESQIAVPGGVPAVPANLSSAWRQASPRYDAPGYIQ